MFKLSFFVEDKALAGILRRIDGARLKDLQVVSVDNRAARKNGELEPTAGSRFEGFVQALKASGGKINTASVRAAATQCGGSAASYSYYLNKAVKQGLIKQKGKGTASTYEWRS